MKDLIYAVAQKYGTDPRAIAGAILAEHSMNTSAADIAQDRMAEHGIVSVLGKQFTFGFGQLHFERAEAAEGIAAQVERRPRRNRRQIIANVLTPEGSIDYIGALLKQAQQIYRANGFNINGDPGVLTTLYNIGDVLARATRARNERRSPEPNYFGCFVEAHMSDIDRILSPPPRMRVAAARGSAANARGGNHRTPAASSANRPPAATPTARATPQPAPRPTPTRGVSSPPAPAAVSEGSVPAPSPIPSVTLVPANSLAPADIEGAAMRGSSESGSQDPNDVFVVPDTGLKTSVAPTACYDEPAFPVDTVEFAAGAQLRALSNDVDCDLHSWVMVQDANGRTGWIARDRLHSDTQRGALRRTCSLVPDAACESTVRNEFSRYLVPEEGSTHPGSLVFNVNQALVVAAPTPAPSVAAPASGGSAMDRIGSYLSPQKERAYMAQDQIQDEIRRYSRMRPATAASVVPVRQAIDALRTRVMRAFGLTQQQVDQGNCGLSDAAETYCFILITLRDDLGTLESGTQSPSPRSLYTEDLAALARRINALRVADPVPDAVQRSVLDGIEMTDELQEDLANLNPFPRMRRDVDQLQSCLAQLGDRPELLARFDQVAPRIDAVATGTFRDEDRPLWLPGVLTGLQQACDETLVWVPRLENQPSSICAECLMRVLDPSSESGELVEVTIPVLKQLLEQEGMSWEEFAGTQIENALRNRLSDLSAYEESDTAPPFDNGVFSRPRDLVDALDRQACIKTVFVGYPWLATGARTVYRPSDDANRIHVETSRTQCEGDQ